MANEVVITVTGKDAGAKKAMEDVSAQGQKVAGSIRGIGQVLGGEFLGRIGQQAFQKLNAFMQQSVAYAKEAAAGQAQLGSVLQSTRGAAGLNADQINRMAGELQNLTNFEDDAIVASSALLLTFTKISGDVFPRAQKSILDVSQAMGTDLQAATTLVGKALNDPIRGVTALTRAGVQLTQAQKDQIATMVEAGDVAGAQTIILHELETQFGGSAEAAVAADGGITQMTNSVGNMQEEIGAKLLPVMVRWTETKLRLLEAVLNLPGPLQAVLAVVTLLSVGFLMIAPRIVAARAALMAFGVTATVANRALGVVGIVLTGLAAALALTTGESIKSRVQMTGLAEDVQRLAETGRAGTELTRLFGGQLAGMGDDAASFTEKLQLATDHSSDFGHKAGEVWQVMSGGANTMHDATQRFEALDEAMAEATNAGADHEALLQGLIETYGLNQEQVALLLALLPEYKTAVERATEGTRSEEQAQKDAADAARLHIDSLLELSDTLRAQVDPAFALIEAQQDLRDAQTAVTEAEQDHGRSSPEYQQALRDEARAALDVLHAAGQLGDEFTGDLSRAQRQMLRDAGISEAAINRLAADLRNAKRDADRLDGTRARVTIQTSFVTVGQPARLPAGGQMVAHAHGGIVGGAGMQSGGIAGPGRAFPAQPTSRILVGEQGPELVDIPLGSDVTPSGQTMAMLGGGGTGPVIVENHFHIDGSRAAQLFVEVLRMSLRTDESLRADVRRAVA